MSESKHLALWFETELHTLVPVRQLVEKEGLKEQFHFTDKVPSEGEALTHLEDFENRLNPLFTSVLKITTIIAEVTGKDPSEEEIDRLSKVVLTLEAESVKLLKSFVTSCAEDRIPVVRLYEYVQDQKAKLIAVEPETLEGLKLMHRLAVSMRVLELAARAVSNA